MLLRDLFHPPLSERRHWTSLHSMWAANIATDLNRRIPQGYFAEPTVAFNLEIDLVVEDERGERRPDDAPESGDWQPPSPARTLPLTLAADLVEVQVFQNEGGSGTGVVAWNWSARRTRIVRPRAMLSCPDALPYCNKESASSWWTS